MLWGSCAMGDKSFISITMKAKGIKAAFIDRDGTINELLKGEVEGYHPYLTKPNQIVILPRVIDGLKLLEKNGFEIIIVTNQSAIGRGILTHEELGEIHRHLEKILATEGIEVSAIYYCPHHPSDNCSCRKPLPGLLEEAVRDRGIDIDRSYMIGDSVSDYEAGRAAGCNSILISQEVCDLYEAAVKVCGEKNNALNSE